MLLYKNDLHDLGHSDFQNLIYFFVFYVDGSGSFTQK